LTFAEHAPEIAAVLAIMMMVLITCSLVVFLALRYLGRSRELLSAERRAAIEKGVDAPMDVATGLPRRFRWNPLKLAILLIGAGVGFGLASVLGSRDLLMYGVFIISIGVANLVYYRLGGKQEWEREAALHDELFRAHVRRLEAPSHAAPRESERA
jgi:hypothetical protein